MLDADVSSGELEESAFAEVDDEVLVRSHFSNVQQRDIKPPNL